MKLSLSDNERRKPQRKISLLHELCNLLFTTSKTWRCLHNKQLTEVWWFLILVQLLACVIIKSSRPSDANVHYHSESSLLQVMPCCLFSVTHFQNQCWLVCWNPGDKLQWDLNQNTNILFCEIAFTNVIISFRPECVKFSCWQVSLLNHHMSSNCNWLSEILAAIFTHWGRVMHICMSKLYHYWFR